MKLDWKDELTAEQRARWNDPSREPFYLFKSIEEELTTSPEFWHTRTSGERMEYLEHTRWVIFGKEAMSTPFVRCYGRRKLGEEPDLKSVVYF